MDKKRPGANDQITRFLLLSIVGIMMAQYFFGRPNKQQATVQKQLPGEPLAAALAGLDPTHPPVLTRAQADAEVVALQADEKATLDTPYYYWALLRHGLLMQYIYQQPNAAGALYHIIINHGAQDAIEAQALYMKGDLQYRQSVRGPAAVPSATAAATLERLVSQGRGSSAFTNLWIFVPRETSTFATTPTLPRGGFVAARVQDCFGPASPNPPGILQRVNANFSQSWYYRMFDTVVHWFGARPSFSYGLAILFFAIMTRLVLQPLTKKQYESMRGMQLIAPEMKKVQERYKGKSDQASQMAMMKEIRELQSRHGVSPMLGCGLALVQLPVFFVFVYPLIQHYQPQMELQGASFLWVKNLGHPDIPLLVLYAVSMLLSFRLSSPPPADDQQRQQQMMMLVMPVLFPFFLKSYPSAFILYWMAFNVISTVFQYRMMKAADPEKSVVKTLVGDGFSLAALRPAPALQSATNGRSQNATAVPPRPTPSRNGSSENGGKKSFDGTLNAEPLEDDQIDGADSQRKPRGGANKARRRRRH